MLNIWEVRSIGYLSSANSRTDRPFPKPINLASIGCILSCSAGTERWLKRCKTYWQLSKVLRKYRKQRWTLCLCWKLYFSSLFVEDNNLHVFYDSLNYYEFVTQGVFYFKKGMENYFLWIFEILLYFFSQACKQYYDYKLQFS